MYIILLLCELHNYASNLKLLGYSKSRLQNKFSSSITQIQQLNDNNLVNSLDFGLKMNTKMYKDFIHDNGYNQNQICHLEFYYACLCTNQ